MRPEVLESRAMLMLLFLFLSFFKTNCGPWLIDDTQ